MVKTTIDGYRGIAVMSPISRIYGRVLKNIIECEYVDHEVEEQTGFHAGSSTVDHLLCVTHPLEKMPLVNKEVHLVFVDLKKVYDSVPLVKLWEVRQQI